MEKQKLLLMMPAFMGYEYEIVRALQDKYEVTFANNIEHRQEAAKRLHNSIPLRLLSKIKLFRPLCWRYVNNVFFPGYAECVQLDKTHFDACLCINGDELPTKFLSALRKKNQKTHFVLYLWDDVSNLQGRQHFKYFESIYSFNIEDCGHFGFEYLPMFVPFANTPRDRERNYDISIIGTAHPDRLESAKRVYEKYHNKFKFFIYMYHPYQRIDWFGHDVPLSLEEYYRVLADSRVTIDIPYYKQRGPTTRAFDAYSTKTKVLTTNPQMGNYPIFSPNIAFLDRESLFIESDFVYSPFKDIKRTFYQPKTG